MILDLLVAEFPLRLVLLALVPAYALVLFAYFDFVVLLEAKEGLQLDPKLGLQSDEAVVAAGKDEVQEKQPQKRHHYAEVEVALSQVLHFKELIRD